MRYHVTLNGQSFEIDLTGDRVVIDGVEHRAELRPVAGTPLRLLLVDGHVWSLAVAPAGQGMWVVHKWGERHEVEVLDERARHIRSLVGAGTAHPGPQLLKAPMPGLVVRVLVQPGQTVAAGEGLVVLEAMKMENELKAGGPGIVDRIEVSTGQAVEKGTPLVTFRT
jgi:biotin carboxyl carrier protein